MNENTLRLVLENDSYSQVKEVYWNDNRVGAVRVDVSFSAGKFPYVRVEMAMIDVVFGGAEPVKAMVMFESCGDDTIKCAYCGTQQEGGRSKCSSCGASLEWGYE